MAGDSFLTPELLSLIGRETEAVSEEVSAYAIRHFAKAVFDENPLYRGSAGAEPPSAGIIAPPAFFLGIAKPFWEGAEGESKLPIKAKTTVAGGEEWEWLAPIRAGDVITRKSKLIDIYEKQGKNGPMLFMVNEATFTNQHGEIAVRAKMTVIAY